MTLETVPVIICGASGRMGKELIELAQVTPGIELVGACVRSSSPLSGRILGGVKVTNSLQDAVRLPDSSALKPVVIDFSSCEALDEHASSAAQLKLPLLVGVTGVQARQLAHLQKISSEIPIMVAPNTSMGANLLALLSGIAAQILENADVEICETHHRFKKDSPSGLAHLLADRIAKVRGKNLAEVGCFDRHEAGLRKNGEIGLFGLRGGNVIGTHTVHLFDEDETLELTHRANNRRIFAVGALKASRFLAEQPAGLYNMFDVFKMGSLLREKV